MSTTLPPMTRAFAFVRTHASLVNKFASAMLRCWPQAISILAVGVVGACSENTAPPPDAGADVHLAITPMTPSPWELNKATLANTRWADVKPWTLGYQRQRFIADILPESAGCDPSICGRDLDEWCPGAAAAAVRLPGANEFTSRRQDENVLQLRQSCLDKVRKDVGERPKLLLTEVGLRVGAYDFESSRYLLSGGESAGTLTGAAFLKRPGVVAIEPHGFGTCSPESDLVYGALTIRGVVGEHLGSLAHLAPRAPTPRGGNVLAVALPLSAAQAETMKPRLDESEKQFSDAVQRDRAGKVDIGKAVTTGFMRIQIAFSLSEEKKADAECHYRNMRLDIAYRPAGFVGDAVGYRIVDTQGVLVDWTPFGER